MNVNAMSVNLSEVTAGTFPIWHAPTDSQGGGVTILGAELIGSGTITATLVTMTNAGTPAVNGTVGSMGGTIAAGVPAVMSVSDAFVDGGEYLGVVLSANAVDATFMSVNYVMGR
jgi:hypothetical protein